MDDIDRKILELLSTRGRTSWTELAGVLGLSGPAAAERVRRLEDRGIITGYAALVDPSAVGCDLLAYIDVGLGRPEQRAEFQEWARSCPLVRECHGIAGDFDFRLKVWCGGVLELERFISEELRPTLGLGRTSTTVVLSTSKDSHSIPSVEPESAVQAVSVGSAVRASVARRNRVPKRSERLVGKAVTA
jgi:Lrp/AsnC family leucine-responsive transcriptional regulator